MTLGSNCNIKNLHNEFKGTLGWLDSWRRTINAPNTEQFSDYIAGWCLWLTMLLCAVISLRVISQLGHMIFSSVSLQIQSSYPNKEIREAGLYSLTHIYNLLLLYYHRIGDRTKLLCSFRLQGLVLSLVMHNRTMSSSVSQRNWITALFYWEVVSLLSLNFRHVLGLQLIC